MKKLKTTIQLTLILGLFLTSHLTIYAANQTIIFDHQNQSIQSDLFDHCKGLMPGDQRNENIIIENHYKEYEYIKIYMQAVANKKENIQSIQNPSDQDIIKMNEFLSQLTMDISTSGQRIFNGSPDQQGDLENKILIGKLNANEKLNLQVKLDVPLSLGNEYAYNQGEIDWIFTIEGINKITDQPIITGDETKRVIFVSLNLVAISTIIYLKKSKKEKA